MNSSASELSFLGAPVLLLPLVAMSEGGGKVADGGGGGGTHRTRVLRGGERGKMVVDQCTCRMLHEHESFSRMVIPGTTSEAQRQYRLGRVFTQNHGDTEYTKLHGYLYMYV